MFETAKLRQEELLVTCKWLNKMKSSEQLPLCRIVCHHHKRWLLNFWKMKFARVFCFEQVKALTNIWEKLSSSIKDKGVTSLKPNRLCRLYGSSKPKPCLVTANAGACRKKKSREFKPNTRNEVSREMKRDHLPSTCHKCLFRISHPGTANGRHHMPGNLIWSTQSYIIYVILNHALSDGGFLPWHPVHNVTFEFLVWNGENTSRV